MLTIVACALAPQGCATQSQIPVPVALQTEPWQWHELKGRAVTTPHYRILTTIDNDIFLLQFSRLMEAAYTQYAKLVMPPPLDRPLEIEFFKSPQEWMQYTRQTTGSEASIYLRVVGGGYAIGDRFACWLGNAPHLQSVATHEGFHQYVARTFIDRPPPAIEEGIATTFENVKVVGNQIVFDAADNPRRREGLVRAGKEFVLLQMDTLIQLHAGDVLNAGVIQSEGFYGQCWALARMLTESPKYRPGFLLMLHDLQQGKPRVSLGPNTRLGIYRPAAIRPLLQAYVAPDWDAFCTDYAKFMERIISGKNYLP